MSAEELQTIQENAIEALKTCYDPEIPVDVWELGLIYELRLDKEANVAVIMTLTSPSCPSAQAIPADIRLKLKNVEGIKDIKIDIVFDPPWTYDMMSEVAKLELGFL